MRRAVTFCLAAVMASGLLSASPPAGHRPIVDSPALDRLVRRIADQAIVEFASEGVTEDSVSITIINLKPRADGSLSSGSFRGDAAYYPASTIKLFYGVYYEHLRSVGKIRERWELARAVADMLTVSSNDACGFVLDCITGTTSGPQIIDPAAWKAWKWKRNAVNRFFRGRGYSGLNADQKTFCEGSYGRETFFRGGDANGNRITPNLGARLVKEIAEGEIVTGRYREDLLALMARDLAHPFDPVAEGGWMWGGRALPPGSLLWCKEGDAYDVRHNIAWVRTPDGADFVIAAMTKWRSENPCLLERIFELAGKQMK
jgi:Beta-lactamase enzyme family